MAKDPSFPFYYSDWLGSTKHAMMSPAQRGAYIDLLCHQWADPTCSLPDDDDALAALSGLGEGWFANGSHLLRKCFPPHPSLEGRIANPRLLEVRAEKDEWRRKSSMGGRKSQQIQAAKRAAKRSSGTPTGGSGTPKGGPTTLATTLATTVATKRQPNPQPNGNPPSPSPSPSPSSSSSSSPVGAGAETGRPEKNLRGGRGDHWQGICDQANRCAGKLGLSEVPDPRDRSLLLKLCALVDAGEIPEHWLVDSVEATAAAKRKKRGTNVWAYLQSCIVRKAEDAGTNLFRLLADVEVPERLLHRKAGHYLKGAP